MTEIFNSIAERLEDSLPIPVVCEVEGDVEKRLQLNVGKQKAAALVAFDGLAPDKQSEGFFVGKVSVTVTVYEKPVVNRAKPGEPHLLDFAETVRSSLTCFKPEGAASRLFYRRTTPISEQSSEIGDVIACAVVFDLKTTTTTTNERQQ